MVQNKDNNTVAYFSVHVEQHHKLRTDHGNGNGD